MTSVLALVIIAGVVLYLLKPEERGRFGRAIVDMAGRAFRAATYSPPSSEPFHDFLRARTHWTVVTPLLIALNTAMFALVLFGGGESGHPQTLVNWGGNIALRTANGEWWRLINSTFVHSGLLHLLATIAVLAGLGFILERAVGPVAFLSTYLASGVVANVVALWMTSALGVTNGASGAIFGIYGLLIAGLVWCLIDGATLSIPIVTAKRIGAATGLFLVYNLWSDALRTTSELAGLVTGFACGLVTMGDIVRSKPPIQRSAWVTGVTIAIAVLAAIPLRGVADVAPEIARVVAAEERTIGVYEGAVARFRKHRITTDALVEVINGTVLPELEATHARLKALRGVPHEHVPLVAAAQEYVGLRQQSWRRRAEGLLQSNPRILREAEETERAALDALRRLRPAS